MDLLFLGGDVAVELQKEEKERREKVCFTWHILNLWISYLTRVINQAKNGRKWEGFKWEGSRTREMVYRNLNCFFR
jgi:hypothetical protein